MDDFLDPWAGQEDSLAIGDWVQLRHDLGDHHNGKSTVVPKGWPAKVIEFYRENSYDYVRLEVFNPPSQPVLTTTVMDFANIWLPCPKGWTPSLKPDGWKSHPRTRFDRVNDADGP